MSERLGTYAPMGASVQAGDQSAYGHTVPLGTTERSGDLVFLPSSILPGGGRDPIPFFLQWVVETPRIVAGGPVFNYAVRLVATWGHGDALEMAFDAGRGGSLAVAGTTLRVRAEYVQDDPSLPLVGPDLRVTGTVSFGEPSNRPQPTRLTSSPTALAAFPGPGNTTVKVVPPMCVGAWLAETSDELVPGTAMRAVLHRRPVRAAAEEVFNIIPARGEHFPLPEGANFMTLENLGPATSVRAVFDLAV